MCHKGIKKKEKLLKRTNTVIDSSGCTLLGYRMGALPYSPPTFNPRDSSTHTVSPIDIWSAERLILVTVDPSPNPKWITCSSYHLYLKILDPQEFLSILTVTVGLKYFTCLLP